MSRFEYDQIVVTGCSFSCGMEMNDQILPAFKDDKERQSHIWKWAKDTLDLKTKNVNQLHENAFANWEKNERVSSWPYLLQYMTKIPVQNLSSIGASIGHSLIKYSQFLETIKFEKKSILAIHQLPSQARMYMRFDQTNGRVNVLPSDIFQKGNFGFDKKHYARQIHRLRDNYLSRIRRPEWLDKFTDRILSRLESLSLKNKVKSYYIKADDRESKIPKNKVVLEDFSAFRLNYSTGPLGHPNVEEFNKDLCEKIISTCLQKNYHRPSL